ncbi:MAG TPA: diiron oxygenase [Paucimonas sp.]|nr:diiron oxygenase [Paucimonas sp.]
MYTTLSTDSARDNIQDRVSAMLADSWASRVAVKTGDLDPSRYYDKSIPDYPPHLVPFRDDPRYRALDPETRQRILAGAWIAYNEKTIDIEMSVTAPACALLLKGAFPGLDTLASKRLIAQTQIDEQFHVLMCLEACLLARKMHDLEALAIPRSLVTQELMKALSNAARPRDAELIRVAFAAVAEVTVNQYLNILADDRDIQPFNRETTALHRKDESTHHDIYKGMVKSVFGNFTGHDRAVFIQALTAGLEAFVKIDFGAWREILRFLDIEDADAIIDACLAANKSKRIVRDYSGFRSLLAEIGVQESEIAFEFDSSP